MLTLASTRPLDSASCSTTDRQLFISLRAIPDLFLAFWDTQQVKEHHVVRNDVVFETAISVDLSFCYFRFWTVRRVEKPYGSINTTGLTDETYWNAPGLPLSLVPGSQKGGEGNEDLALLHSQLPRATICGPEHPSLYPKNSRNWNVKKKVDLFVNVLSWFLLRFLSWYAVQKQQ